MSSLALAMTHTPRARLPSTILPRAPSRRTCRWLMRSTSKPLSLMPRRRRRRGAPARRSIDRACCSGGASCVSPTPMSWRISSVVSTAKSWPMRVVNCSVGSRSWSSRRESRTSSRASSATMWRAGSTCTPCANRSGSRRRSRRSTSRRWCRCGCSVRRWRAVTRWYLSRPSVIPLRPFGWPSCFARRVALRAC